MGVLDGKVAFISGAARGQGRSHAVRMAQEGADVIAFDVCEQLPMAPYELATEADLAETVRQVQATGRRIVARKADVRYGEAVQAVFDEGIAALGRIDIVVANAGVIPASEDANSFQPFYDALDVMLKGVYHTCEVAVPPMVQQGQGGSIIITSSTAGLKGITRTFEMSRLRGMVGYAAAKHGVVGLMRCYANALGPHSIRCNTLHPTGVNTPMIATEFFDTLAVEHPTLLESLANALPVPMVEALDIANAAVFLASDAARYITGVTLPVDAGATVR